MDFTVGGGLKRRRVLICSLFRCSWQRSQEINDEHMAIQGMMGTWHVSNVFLLYRKVN